jgi:hypothetical protein
LGKVLVIFCPTAADGLIVKIFVAPFTQIRRVPSDGIVEAFVSFSNSP